MDDLTMGVRDARRLGVVEAALRGKLTNGDAAEALGLSVRQLRRLKRRVERACARGLIHGNRGALAEALQYRTDEARRFGGEMWMNRGVAGLCPYRTTSSFRVALSPLASRRQK